MNDSEVRERCAKIVLSIETAENGSCAGAERSTLRRAAYLISVDRTDREDDAYRITNMQIKSRPSATPKSGAGG